MLEVTKMKSSPEALKLATANYVKVELDFASLEVGESLSVPVGMLPLGTLRNRATKASKELERRFAVLNHGTVYEVARIE